MFLVLLFVPIIKAMVTGSPGIVVMGRDLHSEGHGFESRHHILDGHFFAYICCKNCNDVDLKRPKKRKRDRRWPIFKKNISKR